MLHCNKISISPIRMKVILLICTMIFALSLFPLAVSATSNTTSYNQLSVGSKGQEVTVLQNRLKELGYFTVTADGIFGNVTKGSLTQYQQAAGFDATGIATSDVLVKLYSSQPVNDLTVNSTGTAVHTLQNRLNELGFTVPTSGTFDSVTKDELILYQKIVGLDATGVATNDVFVKLYSSQPINDLSYGSKGTAVKTLQNRLKELGFFTVSPDSIFGNVTKGSLIRYQQAAGFNETGIATKEVLTKLYSSAPYNTLTIGSSGAAVRTLQNRLKELGLFTVTADGIFGNVSKGCIIRYQQAVGLAASGIATNDVLVKLYSTKSIDTLTIGSAGTAVSNLQNRLNELGFTVPTSGTFDSVTKDQLIIYQKIVGLDATGNATNDVFVKLYSSQPINDLTFGSTGTAVKTLQNRLKELGLFTVTADGIFGNVSKGCIIRYQQAVGLNTDGIASQSLLTKLYSTNPVDTLSVGSKGTAVSNLQKCLNELGFTVPTSGTFDSVTKDELILYQKIVGLDATGTATNDVFVKLYSSQPINDLTFGSTGTAVKTLQNRLKELGLFTVTADGIFGNVSKGCIIRYQQAVGLNIDGIATRSLLTKLYSTNPFDTLEVGSTGTAVTNLQDRLKELGFFTVSSDGTFGKVTKGSLIRYQQAAGLDADGIATQPILVKIYSSNPIGTFTVGDEGAAVSNLQSRLNELGFTVPSNGKYDDETKAGIILYQKIAGFDATGIATNDVLIKLYGTEPVSSLTFGSTGTAVKTLQNRLKELGLFTVTADGIFGNVSKGCIIRYQQAVGFNIDGIASQSLLTKLYSTNPIDTLAVGSTGTAVTNLQDRLKELGFFTVSSDGTFGNVTKDSLTRYQKAAGLVADGIASPNLLVKIYSAAPYNELAVGSSGEAVKSMQSRLNELGFTVSTDGKFGDVTKSRLSEYQKVARFSINGIASSDVLAKLYSAVPFVMKGIDVSAHRGIINWDAVKNSGVDFAIIRCGYGDDLTYQDDEQFARNVSECERLGIPWGTYLYCYANNVSGTEASAESEYQHIKRLLQGKRPTLPVYIDMEEDYTEKYPDINYADIANYICAKLKSAGYCSGVYANLYWWDHYLNDSRLNNYEKWVAQYYKECQYDGAYGIWQYASDGSVSGISGNVDMDYCYTYYPIKIKGNGQNNW